MLIPLSKAKRYIDCRGSGNPHGNSPYNPKTCPKCNDRKLYCVAAEVLLEDTWVSDLQYMHALDAANAQFIYKVGQPSKHRIIAVALVVGYFAKDDHGEHLTV